MQKEESGKKGGQGKKKKVIKRSTKSGFNWNIQEIHQT